MEFTTRDNTTNTQTIVFFENPKANDNKRTIPNKIFIECMAKSAFFSFFISAAAFIIIINFLTTTI